MQDGTALLAIWIRELGDILERVCKFRMDINVSTKFMQNARVWSNEYFMAIKAIYKACLCEQTMLNTFMSKANYRAASGRNLRGAIN